MVFHALTIPLTCLLLLILPEESCSQKPIPRTDQRDSIREIVEVQVRENGFSGTVLVAQKGEPIFHASYGFSETDSIQNNLHFSIASVSKLFTSIRILQLVEAGKIDLSLPVIHYLPEFSDCIADSVTTHQLLLHISGLPNESDSVYLAPREPDELIRQTICQHPQNPPGNFNYNNIDYMLLGLLIEACTGASWENEIHRHILEPSGMHHTGFLRHGMYPDSFAYTYSYQQDETTAPDPLFYIENFYAAGCMYSTALDLLRLDQSLYDHSLLGAQGIALLSRSYPEYNYTGYGVWNYNYPFVDSNPRIMERRGGILGANVVLVRLTDTKQTIIILSNNNRFNPDSFGDPGNMREALIRLCSY
jgi:CubicO group peptidase (beta-lactamase class C family)